jgi:plastocyanin
MRIRSTVISIAVLLLAPWRADANQVLGRVRVAGRADPSAAITIVFAESLDSRTPVRPGRFTLTQRNKTFIPRVLPVPAGSTVDFPNQDLIFHNVFSLSRPGPFDLGLYRAGTSKSRVFAEPATYRVFCNIHPQMTAVILILPTSYFAETDRSGSYRLDLPPGRYRLTAWSERAQPTTIEVTVSAGSLTAPDLSLDESGFVELPHKNKFGQDYPKASYDALKDKKQ